MKYPVKLTDVDGMVMVTCAALPEFSSVGNSRSEALHEAVDCIESTLQTCMLDRRDIPAPGVCKRGQHLVCLPPLAAAKLGLYRVMQTQHMRKADLALLLGVHLPQVDRLQDLRHRSKLEQVETALNAVGYRLEVSVLAA